MSECSSPRDSSPGWEEEGFSRSRAHSSRFDVAETEGREGGGEKVVKIHPPFATVDEASCGVQVAVLETR